MHTINCEHTDFFHHPTANKKLFPLKNCVLCTEFKPKSFRQLTIDSLSPVCVLLVFCHSFAFTSISTPYSAYLEATHSQSIRSNFYQAFRVSIELEFTNRLSIEMRCQPNRYFMLSNQPLQMLRIT